MITNKFNLRAMTSIVAILTIYNLFFIDAFTLPTGFWGSGLFVLTLILQIFLFLHRDKGNTERKRGAITGSLAVLFAAFSSLWNNGGLIFANVMMSYFLSCASIFFYKATEKQTLTLRRLIFLPFELAGNMIVATVKCISRIKTEKIVQKTSTKSSTNEFKSQKIQALLTGGLMAFGLMLIIFFLLRGDGIFLRATTFEITWPDLSPVALIARIIITLVIGVFLYSLTLVKIKNPTNLINKPINKLKVLSRYYQLSIVQIGIAALLFFYLMVQARYFFISPSEVALERLGIDVFTYSQYVRQGFFELLLVVAIVLGVLINTIRLLPNLTNKFQTKLLTISATILSIELVLILITASRKLYLYFDAHNFTRMRLYGVAFLLLLLYAIILFSLKVWKRIDWRKFKIGLVIAPLLGLSLANFINWDYLIARNPPTVNYQIDYNYLMWLSTDMCWIRDEIRQSFQKELQGYRYSINQLSRREIVDGSHNLGVQLSRLQSKIRRLERCYVFVFEDRPYTQTLLMPWQVWTLNTWRLQREQERSPELFEAYRELVQEFEEVRDLLSSRREEARLISEEEIERLRSEQLEEIED
ncbi:MAG: DUF4173 domain-containing protein [Pseudomonadales bacterium]|jgi:hypothetical protein|nr:DUF4173 domain-containing protein [Pseudomonadales bacterium]